MTTETTPAGKMAMFIQQTVKSDSGQFIPCIAVEGTKGYNLTSWEWGTDYEAACQLAEDSNTKRGIDPIEAELIIIGTMG
jgi:hypothetical protein